MLKRFLKINIYLLGISLFTFLPGHVLAQKNNTDTLHLTVTNAEEIFLKKNLVLLANQYNVDINKALVLQAKVWDNPVLNTDQNLYDGKFFRHTTTNGIQYGQIYLQVQQLIRTSKKIRKLTQLAQDNVLSSAAQFNDVMRNLKFVLTTDFNNLSQLQNMASVYKNEMQIMQNLVNGMNEMYKIGDISLKENIRIKALLFSLQSDVVDNFKQQIDIQKEVATLLQLEEGNWVVAEASQSISENQIKDLQILSLQDSALKNRPDIEYVNTQANFQKDNIIYQKALAKPDVTLGIEYDKLSSYTPNLFGLSASVPLTIFNKNKGNITAAQLSYKQAGIIVQQVKSQVSKDVQGAWLKLMNASTMLNTENKTLQDNYETLFKNMIISYRQREVNLIEFIDFFDAYKDIRTKQAQQIANQRNAVAELNFTTNKNIIKL